MATYYVQPNGSNANTGLGASNAQAWQTVQKALGATGIGSGDTLYIAPGTYREAITIAGTYSATTSIIGDRTASHFSSISAGYVRITGLASDALGVSTSVGNFTTNGTSYLTFDSLWLEHKILVAASSTNITFIRCQITTPFQPTPSAPGVAVLQITTTGQSAILFDKCYIQGGVLIDGSGTTTTTRFNSCLVQCATYGNGAFEFTNSGVCAMTFSNCTIFGAASQQIFRGYSPPNGTASIYNSLIVPDYCSPTMGSSNATCFVEDFNAGYISRSGPSAGLNTKQLYHRAFTHTPIYINPIDAAIIPYTPLTSDALIGAGSATYSFGTDYFGNAWGSPPSIGAMELKNYGTIGAYNPTERNASTITIAPGSTSQSIELYLGATGLTASTSGLSARYNRTRTVSVSITLVARTIGQAWTSGGFAEVDSTNMPGIYRLDLPDAALAAGADDVTVVVRGASGTNGAVMTVKLSSGGLTSAQTAAAVWDEPYTSHTTASTFGARTLLTTADNRPAAVGTSNHIQSNVHAIVDSTAAASELSGALLHNGTDYISAELVTPVTSAALVRMGPYEVKADGLGASDPLDIQKGAQHGVDIQCVDAFGSGIDITSATVTAKVYNSGATLVDTYSCTATYAADGRATFTIDTTVTNTPGTYTATITRTTGASDTQVFGPLRIYVRDI
jgi:hypothetical protein